LSSSNPASPFARSRRDPSAQDGIHTLEVDSALWVGFATFIGLAAAVVFAIVSLVRLVL
jgi:hypothetical protein